MNDLTKQEGDWYYANNGTTFGPFSLDDLQQKAAQGVITPETLIVPPGQEEWRAYGTVFPDVPSLENRDVVPAKSAAEKKPLSKRDKVLAYGCLLPLMAFAALAFLSDLIKGKGDEQETDGVATFEFTAESFRESLLREAAARDLNHRFQIKQWKISEAERNDYLTVVFEEDQGLMVVLDKKTKKISDITVMIGLGSINSINTASSVFIVPLVVVATVAPNLPKDEKSKVHEAILEAVRNKGKSATRLVGPLFVKAEVFPHLGSFQLYIEPNH